MDVLGHFYAEVIAVFTHAQNARLVELWRRYTYMCQANFITKHKP